MKTIVTLLILSATTINLNGQFLQFSIDVEPEITAGVMQELNFGQITGNSTINVSPDDPNSGWFQLSVINAMEIMIEFESPQYLVLQSDPDCQIDSCRFPIYLNFRHFVSIAPFDGRFPTLIDLNNEVNMINLSSANPSGDLTVDFAYVHINVSGRVVVGDVAPGSYIGELNLVVTY
jgi:hypothetical protein